jgi:hypothetical protein
MCHRCGSKNRGLPKPLVAGGGAEAALVDGVDHQRCAFDRVAGGKDAGHAGHPPINDHIAVGVEFHAQVGH